MADKDHVSFLLTLRTEAMVCRSTKAKEALLQSVTDLGLAIVSFRERMSPASMRTLNGAWALAERRLKEAEASNVDPGPGGSTGAGTVTVEQEPLRIAA